MRTTPVRGAVARNSIVFDTFHMENPRTGSGITTLRHRQPQMTAEVSLYGQTGHGISTLKGSLDGHMATCSIRTHQDTHQHEHSHRQTNGRQRAKGGRDRKIHRHSQTKKHTDSGTHRQEGSREADRQRADSKAKQYDRHQTQTEAKANREGETDRHN